MKPIRTIVLLSLVLLLTSNTVNAQAIPTVTANIPFSFVVSGKSLAAGKYDLGSRNLPGGILLVQNTESSKALAGLTQPLYVNGGSKETKLIFNRYKDDTGEYIYFLSQVWVEGQDKGMEFLKHRAEREASKRAIKRDMITLVVPNTKRTAEQGD